MNTSLSDRRLAEYCEFFDLHVNWLKNGWADEDPSGQAIYEASNPHYASLIKKAHGYGDLEVLVIEPILPYDGPMVLSVDKSSATNDLLINTASFYEGEVRRLADLGLPDYHFESFDIVAKTKNQLKAKIGKYGKYLHEKYSGDYGKIYVKYI